MEDSEIFTIVKKNRFFELINNKKKLSGVQNNFLFNFLSVKLFLENEIL